MSLGTMPSSPTRPRFLALRAGFGWLPAGLVLTGCLLHAVAFADCAQGPGHATRAALVADCKLRSASPELGCCLLHAFAIGVDVEPVAESGLRIERDFESGGFGMPSGDFAGKFSGLEAAMLSHDSHDLVQTMLPGGGFLLDLRGRFQSLSLASKRSDGTVVTGCEDHELGVLEWLRANGSGKNPSRWPEK